MKLFIRNKLLSLGGSSDVLDENEEKVFTVKGKVISPTKKKEIYDKEDNLIYTIRNRWFNFFSYKVFVYDANGDKLATIKKGKWSFSTNYKIEDCVDEMEFVGKFFSGTSQIMKNGQQVGVVVKDFSIINDYYTLEADEKDITFLTALVIAFDNLRDKIRED